MRLASMVHVKKDGAGSRKWYFAEYMCEQNTIAFPQDGKPTNLCGVSGFYNSLDPPPEFLGNCEVCGARRRLVKKREPGEPVPAGTKIDVPDFGMNDELPETLDLDGELDFFGD